ncbi:MAG TPA: tryptophan--tRNA ligase [Candidatus Ratteibacteria bacterium]|jgi:tryptophanyl-tRNA synthetase|uniref:Tryptophan--tRNA ligase n=1 Tax=candidate division TA06 bacterium ADurb.Bin131 TaxID=1852827 RepID=A0A1V6C4B1_UNCT6|nr:MAG: Tryptophan--tRNA ligase [candidate division TA06 bacterium ADurb.Bin131]HON04987.1 tryptophan--tRNA ligase [bacterium]HOQ82491.1 tryptophan--tRNA ligase [bacterium]HRS06806.1 tryptophan--tRNA ligase [Candidatus Ratteibacteria bacterium]HRV04221.1 tryptophan--tRNA ligase [Candidatus Ratteibacteria bacterium]
MNLRTSKGRILSGMRPTGPLHIGHLFGALENWRRLQDEGYHCFYMIADWHALSTEYQNPESIKDNVFEIAVDFLSCGLDPKKSVIFIQSNVKEHSELNLIFSMIVPVPWLERNPVYKEQMSELKEKDLNTFGFLGYPVLQAADILIYRADYVPIGVDQLPHLELTREIARRFNFLYGEYFPEPKELLTETPKIPGTDGRKMSKSYGNAIYLKDSEEEISAKVSKMFTDQKRLYRKDPGHPDECAVFAYRQLVSDGIGDIKNKCLNAEIGCTDCKKQMGRDLIEFLRPVQERRKYFSEHREDVWEILHTGSEKAMGFAKQTMKDVQKLVGMEY